MENWILIYSTSFYAEAAIVKGHLEEQEIPVQILNKQDSMYQLALQGMHELYVPAHLKEQAIALLNDALRN